MVIVAEPMSYAEAILKTQIVASAPLGAAWPPNSAQSLKERIAMLKYHIGDIRYFWANDLRFLEQF